jgi:hypothetical protein
MTFSSSLIPCTHPFPGIFLYPEEPRYWSLSFWHVPAGTVSGPTGTHSPSCRTKLKSLARQLLRKGGRTIHNPLLHNHSSPRVLLDPRICGLHSRRRRAFCGGTIAVHQLQLRHTQKGKQLTLRPIRHSCPSELLAFHLSKSSSVHCRVCNGAKSRKIMACLPSDPESFREAVPRSRNLFISSSNDK